MDLRGRICMKNFYRNFACKILNSKSYITIEQDLVPCHRFHRKSLRPNSVAQEFCPNSANGEISPRFTLMTYFHFVSATYFAVYLVSSFCRKGLQICIIRTQTSRSKFHKFRLFFHLDHVWDRFDHAFRKQRFGVRIYGVKLGF